MKTNPFSGSLLHSTGEAWYQGFKRLKDLWDGDDKPGSRMESGLIHRKMMRKGTKKRRSGARMSGNSPVVSKEAAGCSSKCVWGYGGNMGLWRGLAVAIKTLAGYNSASKSTREVLSTQRSLLLSQGSIYTDWRRNFLIYHWWWDAKQLVSQKVSLFQVEWRRCSSDPEGDIGTGKAYLNNELNVMPFFDARAPWQLGAKGNHNVTPWNSLTQKIYWGRIEWQLPLNGERDSNGLGKRDRLL